MNISEEFGIFNADKKKICAHNEVSPDDPAWSWLYDRPFDLRHSEEEARNLVETINAEREESGELSSCGPVKYRRRDVSYGEWHD